MGLSWMGSVHLRKHRERVRENWVREAACQHRHDRVAVGLGPGRQPEGDRIEVADPPHGTGIEGRAAERLHEFREVALVGTVAGPQPPFDRVVRERGSQRGEGSRAFPGCHPRDQFGLGFPGHAPDDNSRFDPRSNARVVPSTAPRIERSG